MEFHRSCVLPSNAPALPAPDSTIPSRVLQERSGNRENRYIDDSNTWKREPTSPSENASSVAASYGGSYYPSNLGSQLVCEKSEEQIDRETEKLWTLLQNCEKYRKYRERQPTTAKAREQKWPEPLEYAFFRGISSPHANTVFRNSHVSLGTMAADGSTEAYAR